MRLPPTTSTLFPYTTLFRSMYELPEIEMVRANLTERFSGIPIQKVYVNAKVLLGKRIKFLDELTHRSEEHTSELQSRENLVCRLLLEKKKKKKITTTKKKQI